VAEKFSAPPLLHLGDLGAFFNDKKATGGFPPVK